MISSLSGSVRNVGNDSARLAQPENGGNYSAIDINFFWLGQKRGGGNGSARFQVYLAQPENVGSDLAIDIKFIWLSQKMGVMAQQDIKFKMGGLT